MWKEKMSPRNKITKMPNDHANNVEVQMTKLAALKDVLSYVKEYCKCSGVHGFRYLSEEHRTYFEKLFWATAIFISTLGCVMMIMAIKTKMDTTPVIVTMVENPTKVWHVPFPAVTVCPGSPSRLTAFNLTKFLQLTVTNRTFLEHFISWVNESKNNRGNRDFYDKLHFSDYNEVFNESSWIGNATLRNSLYKKLWALHALSLSGAALPPVTEFPGGKETLALDEDDMEFLVEVAPKMHRESESNNILQSNCAFWKSKFTYLDQHFKHLWTDNGMCFTFNMMDNIHVYKDGIINNDVFKRRGLDKNFPKSSNDWDPDNGYTVLRRQTYPWRAPHERERERNILTVLMTEDKKDVFEYWGKGSGEFMIMFHQPQDHPVFSLNNKAIMMPFHKLLDINIQIDVMTTSPKLVKYDPRKRQCYYSYERHLEYFKFYSQNNCQLECLTNISLRKCGCVAFYMPRYKTTKICGRDAYNCLSQATLHSDESEMDAAFKDLSRSGHSPFNTADSNSECNCLPSCLSISYDADVLTTRDFDASRLERYSSPNTDSHIKLAAAGVYIKLKNTVFTASQRSEYYGEIDFLANCGGFLGLFCGFSILSFIEIIYFLTIRLWTNIYRRLTSRPSELPKVFPDADVQVLKAAFDIPPSVDHREHNSDLTTCVCKNLPPDVRRAMLQSSNEEKQYSGNLHHDFRR